MELDDLDEADLVSVFQVAIEHDDFEWQLAVLRHPLLSDVVFERIFPAKVKDSRVRDAVVERAATCVSDEPRLKAALSRKLTIEQIDQLIERCSFKNRRRVIGSPSVPPSIWFWLDDGWFVRSAQQAIAARFSSVRHDSVAAVVMLAQLELTPAEAFHQATELRT